MAQAELTIDLDAVAANWRALAGRAAHGARTGAVVKADGYGHGAVMAAQTALLNGASHLAVASFLEAMALRDAGVDAPILVLTYAPDHAVRRAVQRNITLTCFDLEQARAYDRAAEAAGGKLRVHVKVDTGMGRLGMFPDEAMPFFRQVASFEHIEIEGIYTHFSSADDDSDYTNEQIRRFKQVVRPLQAGGF
ncbi:MAG: alanine racemase, partial [Gemmobacter sp.]